MACGYLFHFKIFYFLDSMTGCSVGPLHGFTPVASGGIYLPAGFANNQYNIVLSFKSDKPLYSIVT